MSVRGLTAFSALVDESRCVSVQGNWNSQNEGLVYMNALRRMNTEMSLHPNINSQCGLPERELHP
jgi:hypothetical protein